MSDAQYTPVPESFLRLYAGWRGRLLRPLDEIRQRHEFCEDLAGHLVPAAQALHHDDGLGEDDVLQRCLVGLSASASGLADGEAGWVVTRLAELLHWSWRMPAVPPSDAG